MDDEQFWSAPVLPLSKWRPVSYVPPLEAMSALDHYLITSGRPDLAAKPCWPQYRDGEQAWDR